MSELEQLKADYTELEGKNQELEEHIAELQDAQKDTYDRIVELYKSVN